jgi:hypothetical protein
MMETIFRTWIAQGARGRFSFTEPATARRWYVEYVDDRDFDGHFEVGEVGPAPATAPPLRFSDADAVVAYFAHDRSLSRQAPEAGGALPPSGTGGAS